MNDAKMHAPAFKHPLVNLKISLKKSLWKLKGK